MWGGTKVPGGNVACQEKQFSVRFFGTYVWPRMFQVMPWMPSLARVIPATSLFIGWLLPCLSVLAGRALLGVAVAIVLEYFLHDLGLEFAVRTFCNLGQIEVLDRIAVGIELEVAAQRGEVG